MTIAITDANVFIDLIKLQLLGYLFRINLEIYTTQEVIDELNESQLLIMQAFIQSQSLIIYKFTEEEIIEIHNVQAPKGLTFEDKTVAWLAIKLTALILSGDNLLRKYCLKQQLDVKGVIWLFESFIEYELINHVT